MSVSAAPDAAQLLRTLPKAVSALAETLWRAGHEAFLVGGCVRDTLRGAPIGDFDLATSASPNAVLTLFPRAIPTGLRHGTVTIPTPLGPVDVTTYRAGGTLREDLGHRDFTVNAIAVDPRSGVLVDPFGGRVDLEANRLRGVGDPAERLAEDPLRALRAARLVATLGFEADGALEDALASVSTTLPGVARERLRAELEALLFGERAGAGLALLLRTGLLQRLVPGVRQDVPRVVDALPPDLAVRLAGLLRGTRASSILAALRIQRRISQRTALLLRSHPIEGGVDPASDGSIRRLLQRLGAENVDALVALRRAEFADAPALDAIEAALARVRRAGALALHRLDLALDGRAVMAALRCRPGRTVGLALGYLTERVVENPALNTPETLRELLATWKAEGGDAG